MTLPARRLSTTAVEAAGRVAGLARSLGVPADAIVAVIVMPPARTAARVGCLDCGHAWTGWTEPATEAQRAFAISRLFCPQCFSTRVAPRDAVRAARRGEPMIEGV